MEKIIKNLGLEYIGIRYSAGDRYKARFNPVLAEHQASILSGNYSDSETKQLLQSG